MSITVTNQSGQTVSLSTDGPKGKAVKEIIESRIARGELTKGTKAEEFVVIDAHSGLKDENGNWLKSVHGGGLDPDVDGDALGQPSGSEASGAAATSPTEPVKKAVKAGAAGNTGATA